MTWHNRKEHLVKTSDIFGRLTVLGFSHADKRWRRHYKVRCECGAVKTVQGTLLRSGNTKSCGCLGRDQKRQTRLPDNAGIIHQIRLGCERHARTRNLAFSLSRQQFAVLVCSPCHYCGTAFSNLRRNRHRHCKEGFPHNGIDRINNEHGYVLGNVVACCRVCNRAKRDMNEKDFIAWIDRLADYRRKQEGQAARIELVS